MRVETGKAIVFQPEYGPAETPDHPFNDLRKVRWAILGGLRRHTTAVADLYKTTFSAEFVIQQTDAKTAELTKYMENTFLALKVAFCNEFYDIAGASAWTTTNFVSSGCSTHGSAEATHLSCHTRAASADGACRKT